MVPSGSTSDLAKVSIPADEFADGADVGLEVEEFAALGAMADGDTVLCDSNAVITF